MSGARIAAVIVTIALIVISAVAVIALDPLGPSAPSAAPGSAPGSAAGSAAATASAPASGIATAPSALEVVAALEGPHFTFETEHAPTADVGQSKLWFNADAWWGALIAEGTNEFRIHRLDWATQAWVDTGVRIGPHSSVFPDVLAEGDHVWIATGGGATSSRLASLVRYTYLPEAGRYAVDSDMPVTIAEEQAPGLTIARDRAGRLWAAWIADDQLRLNRTEGNDWIWGTPYTPALDGADANVDAAVLAAHGETVAIAWTRTDVDAVNVAVAEVAEVVETEAWDQQQIAVEGLVHDDDELYVSTLSTGDDTRLYAAVRTSISELPGSSSGAAQLLLLVVEADGSSRQYLVGQVSDRHGRPLVVIDAESRAVYVVATSPSSGGTIVYKSASLDDLSFVTGPGTPLLSVAGLPLLDDATSTKQVLGGSTGIVVLASDPVAGSYAHAAARFPGTTGPGTTLPPIVPPETDRLADDMFDPYPPGSQLGPQWVRRSSGTASFTIEEVDGRMAAAAFGVPDGSSVRMCREIAPIADGSLRIETEFSTSRVGPLDATVLSVRHGSAESAVVRLSDRGTFSFFRGPQQVRSAVPYAPGTWYTGVVTLDLEAQTYGWEVRRSSDGVLAFAVEDVPWRTPDPGSATDICFESPGATAPEAIFAIDRVVVDR